MWLLYAWLHHSHLTQFESLFGIRTQVHNSISPIQVLKEIRIQMGICRQSHHQLNLIY